MATTPINPDDLKAGIAAAKSTADTFTYDVGFPVGTIRVGDYVTSDELTKLATNIIRAVDAARAARAAADAAKAGT